ncbi:hypothetical protein AS034_07230 [[Bacillus] enclensis]|uniref:UPF0354 protein GA0061094_1509 n=1 Tax=[Bacillus] enclensis TaxID=1402860 RepID=A0A0V8HNF5_9BACI|nr:DUF1444 domain-containing protein [[Bacillus] enclensis]KSU64024.1 hypothetical protein AS034_07230 [[Bacillus] enclensis]MBH9967884.1 DUF1444 domain-containing protein [[Bacillus] enclensis]OAT84557.1 hypothetical protein A6P54_04545 [Bacillus sp. MKU004]SCB93483.1 Uncharacterized protein YtpQ, UPF0354 family [[Bacillus] enclensis]
MDIKKLKGILQGKLDKPNRTFTYDRDKDSLRIENTETGKGITVALPPIVSKWKENNKSIIDEVVYYVEEALNVMGTKSDMGSKEKNVFPVIRSTSFATESNDGIPLVMDDHTAETRIYYAIDLGSTYRLIDENMLKEKGWSHEQMKETALFNVRGLPTQMKKDEVAGNVFYFLNNNDGYDASRILNDAFLKKVSSDIQGEMTVSVPHQDVLVIGDIRNETGYDVLQQMTMSFFTTGNVPITALSFVYEDGDLEPVFILAKNRKK